MGSLEVALKALCSPRLAARGTHRWQSERFAAVGGLNASQPAACSQGALTVGSLRRDVSVGGFLITISMVVVFTTSMVVVVLTTSMVVVSVAGLQPEPLWRRELTLQHGGKRKKM